MLGVHGVHCVHDGHSAECMVCVVHRVPGDCDAYGGRGATGNMIHALHRVHTPVHCASGVQRKLYVWCSRCTVHAVHGA